MATTFKVLQAEDGCQKSRPSRAGPYSNVKHGPVAIACPLDCDSNFSLSLCSHSIETRTASQMHKSDQISDIPRVNTYTRASEHQAVRVGMPERLMCCLTASMETSRRWKIPAASAAAAPVDSNTSWKCSGAPAPLEAMTGIVTAEETASTSSKSNPSPLRSKEKDRCCPCNLSKKQPLSDHSHGR